MKTVLITGGTGGIGSKVSEMCKEKGWNVVITGRSDSTRIDKLIEDGVCDLGYTCDALDKKKISDIAKLTYKKFGRIDALINCAGIVDSIPFEKINIQNAYKEFNVNVLGTIFATQAILPYLLKNKNQSKIINVSSLRGVEKLSSIRSVMYSLSKASIHSLTVSLAKTYSPKILINCIAPGFTLTSMSNSWGKTTWKSSRDSLLKRPAETKEIANHIMFMISDNCTYMTGEIVLVDGGYSISDK